MSHYLVHHCCPRGNELLVVVVRVIVGSRLVLVTAHCRRRSRPPTLIVFWQQPKRVIESAPFLQPEVAAGYFPKSRFADLGTGFVEAMQLPAGLICAVGGVPHFFACTV